MKKIQTWDTVKVIAWKWKWKVAIVTSVSERIKKDKTTQSLVYLEWVNVMKKAVKWQWYKDVVLPIDISNVMYRSDAEKVASKVGIRVEWKKNVRYLKKTGTVIKK